MTQPRPAQLRPSGRDGAHGLPPFDADAEEAVIAALLLDETAYGRVVPILQAEDFFRDANRLCFEACTALAERAEAITHETVTHEMVTAGTIELAGGEPHLFAVTGRHFTAAGVESHARIVARTAFYRRMIAAAGTIAQVAYKGGPDTHQVLAIAETLLSAVRSTSESGDFRILRDLLADMLEDLGEDDIPKHAGVRSGFMDLDVLLGGFKPGDLAIVAARTGVGKSSLLLNFARNASIGQDGVVAFFAIEMSSDQIATRLLAAEARVDATRLRLGTHNVDEETRIMHAFGVLGEASLYIDDTASLGVPEIRAKCRRLQAEHGLDLVIVDYLQLLHSPVSGADNRTAEIGRITRGLKELARELKVPVIAAAQLSRAVEMRRPHIPMLSDLRESGSIEQDADTVLFIYREDTYNTDEAWQDDNPDVPAAQRPRGLAHLIVAKHRNGPTGVVTVVFRDHIASFEDVVLREYPGGHQ